ncbi:MAG: hypothetical protein ACYC3I_22665 [Gemmataceae bacterium]
MASTSYTQIDPVSDIYPTNSNCFVLPKSYTCPVAMVGGGLADHARVNMPSLNVVGLPSLEPVVVNATPVTNSPTVRFGDVGLPIKGQENIEIDVANNAITSTPAWCLLWITDGITPIPQGPVRKLRWTSTSTLTAYTWSQITYTLDTGTLAAGNYSLVGVTSISAGCIASRVSLNGMFERPGFPGLTAEGQIHPDCFREYHLGQLGVFPAYSTPVVSVFSSSADTSISGYFHVVKIS